MVVATERASQSAAPQQRRIFISYKRDTQPDGSLASFLHDSLGSQGHNVFIDVEIPPGSDWSEQLSTEIRSAISSSFCCQKRRRRHKDLWEPRP